MDINISIKNIEVQGTKIEEISLAASYTPAEVLELAKGYTEVIKGVFAEVTKVDVTPVVVTKRKYTKRAKK